MKKILSILTIIVMVMGVVGVFDAQAAQLTGITDRTSRQMVSQPSTHMISFTTPTGAGDVTDTIIIDFPDTFVFTAPTFADITVSADATPLLLAATADATHWGAAFDDTNDTRLTLTHPTNGANQDIAPGGGVVITYTSGVFANAATPNSYSALITGTFGDTGAFSEGIVDDDQVIITGSAGAYLGWDIDIEPPGSCVTANETAPPYLVDIGVIGVSPTQADEAICISEIQGSGAGGLTVGVASANDALVSSIPTVARIENGSGGPLSGAGYGICSQQFTVFSGTTAIPPSWSCMGGSRVGDFNANPAVFETIGSASTPIVDGELEAWVRAEIDGSTVVRNDYTDTLTFRVVNSF